MAVNRKRPSTGKKILRFIGLLVVVAIIGVFAVFVGAMIPKKGESGFSANPFLNWWHGLHDAGEVLAPDDPTKQFGGKQQLNILCMGIDDNWTNSDEEYTVAARTDTLFMLHLDLKNKKATMLSIPRDAYVPIAGTDYSDKINSAYATGGEARCRATVANLLGVTPDYYILLKIDATKNLVNKLGGVWVNVENQMDYDDNWGHLHVHLKPGYQHLMGDDAVGFARYRHGNHGMSPEDGDERRIYRQHVLMLAMVDKLKAPQNIADIDGLVDTAMQQIETDMTRLQLAELAKTYHAVNKDDIETGQIPGKDGKAYGQYVMLLDPAAVKAYTDWLLKGDETASYQITPLRVKNGTLSKGLATVAAGKLEAAGFKMAKVGGNAQQQNVPVTEIIDTGVANKNAASVIAADLGLPNAQIIRQPVVPNKRGWMPNPSVTVVLGLDYAAHAPVADAAPAGSAPRGV